MGPLCQPGGTAQRCTTRAGGQMGIDKFTQVKDICMFFVSRREIRDTLTVKSQSLGAF